MRHSNADSHARYGSEVLIFGGSEGVGRALVKYIAAAGFALILIARQLGLAEATSAALRARYCVTIL